MIKNILNKILKGLVILIKTIVDLAVWMIKSLLKKSNIIKNDSNANKKYKAAKIVVCIMMAFLVVYFAYLMFIQGPKYQEEVYSQQNRTFTQSATRGDIYDCNGKVLATTIEACTICVSRTDVREYGENKYKDGTLSDYQELVASKLSEVLGLEYEPLLEKLQGEGNYWNVATEVETEIGSEISAWIKEKSIKGVTVEKTTKRYYPYGSLAAHLLGFTGTDGHGLVSGIEVGLDDELAGTDGKIIATVEKNGNAITGYPTTTLVEKVDGYNATLTIDVNIQKIAEEALSNAVKEFGCLEGGTVIVMDPNTAEVKAMASNPTFDLNNPREIYEELTSKYFWREGEEYKTAKEAGTLGENQEEPNILSSFVWKNKAISITYEPGSTFKAITASIALEEGVVTPETVVNDDPVVLGEWTIHCSTAENEAQSHGQELFRYGVANSCNPVMARVALAVGIDTFYDYVRAFGFRNKTNILLSGETVGVIHTNPSKTDLAVTAFGQRFTITPIQVATAYCAIANGGTLYEPRIVSTLTDNSGNIVKKYESTEVRQVISEKTSKTVLELLEGVVSEGTGGQAYVAGYRIAGKTGTSQTVSTEIDGRYVVSFSAIAPSDDPKLVVLVVLDHPTIGEIAGSKMGTRIAAEVVKKTLSYMNVERVYDEGDNAKIKNVYVIDDFTGKTVQEAITALKVNSGRMHNVIVVGDNSLDAVIVNQYPQSKTYFCREGTVVLYTTTDETMKADYVTVPNIVGMELGKAHATITDLGINLDARSEGIIATQSIAPGTKVEKGTIITVTFEKKEQK